MWRDAAIGFAMTPISFASRSPILLDIARPGPLLSFFSTLYGPLGTSLIRIWATIPPALTILYASFTVSGSWSFVSYTLNIILFGVYYLLLSTWSSGRLLNEA
jgi:hypothetical protein